jgi:hypothetical protein
MSDDFKTEFARALASVARMRAENEDMKTALVMASDLLRGLLDSGWLNGIEREVKTKRDGFAMLSAHNEIKAALRVIDRHVK